MNVKVLSPQEAAEYLRDNGMSTSPETIRLGIQQGIFPFGVCIKGDKGPIYYIFKKQLYQWMEERNFEEG